MSQDSKAPGPVQQGSVTGYAANALRKFLEALFPDVEVIYAQENNVPIPLGNFIMLNTVGMVKSSTNRRTWKGDQLVEIWAPYEAAIQVDIFGPDGTVLAARFRALWFDSYAYDWFKENDGVCFPLYSGEASQSPFVDESFNFEQRWTFTAYLQVNQTIVLPQQTATKPGVVGFVEVDTGLKQSSTGENE